MKTRNSLSLILSSVFVFAAHSGGAFSEPASSPAIEFLKPNAFQCEANVPWSKLSDWQGVPGKCGQGLLYKVTGKVPGIKDGLIKAKIVVPEDNNKEWAAFNGDTHRIVDSNFEVGFCITTKLATRPIRLQAYTEDGKKHGGRCTVTLVGVQLED